MSPRPLRIGLLYVDNFQQPRSQMIGSLGLGYLAAWLKQEEPDCEVLIAIRTEELINWQPDLIGISAYTETLPLARSFANELKILQVPLILGGAHIASNPADLPLEFEAGVAGEGEEVFLKLVRLVKAKNFRPESLKGITGVTFREQGKVISQGRCPAIQNLDQLAHPDRQLMFAPMQKIWPDFKPILHIHTARGCPYRCSFCSAPLVNPQWRFHSPQWVVAELEAIAHQFPEATDITLSDDLFTLKKSRLEELVSAIRAAGLHKRFFFFCSSRSNTLTPDMCRLLRDMNVLMISFGFEAASDALIKDLKGVGTRQADYERVLALCENFGIYAHGNFIIGSQNETLHDLHKTYHFVRAHLDRLASVYFSHMTPFPGTRVWDEAQAEGLIPENLDFRVLNLEYQRGQSVMLNRHYSEESYEIAYRAFKKLETFLNDRYYREQSFLRELTAFERWQWPEYILSSCEQKGWKKVGILSERETHLPPTSQFVYLPRDPQLWPEDLDALLLYYSLEQKRAPETWLESLPTDLPLICLSQNIGFYYSWALLLLGKWEEGIYGTRQRRNLRYFTRRSLQELFENKGYQQAGIVPHVSQHEPDPSLLKLFSLLGQPEDLQIHSFTHFWLPRELVSPGKISQNAEAKPHPKEPPHVLPI
ncbi:hypothetical protein COW36_02440 [bacterium (Candidatus Blackallbacteria) CG17_big_fil_post_rev_8_21_14_2_50_48_46]|uniref:Uncharacterized protein n=1 Tax=bacterium (Candidatus Blackallbacteria) CG17_big_fil_post_rev_8_21_14_2_50_48_46 TaxID=2014261 RepID=A0A2M7GAN7_9BACT|nr:MAG: hypothetical protein COW64_13030 [bacterium (Candidatus Blackallbacteria) CG18_big_fil_WC_8_21_14_2_50_49_26]PIW18987.1 MAG: hypothetical protein COW36_02440 [bacterium (Candidatus Blackallbacteria) CG17_big_fil_post_rev_8_21_14_2_50_48_46]PIW44645.1 MAG: hypothetical protein COW20_23675 [bacterium (Candidatus Blackallbacteria) CG13_big_fil_rev_8_21_14_2_50_49_14]